jgi:SAM-dependent methyltransferase
LEQYDEYLARSSWKYSEWAQNYVAKRLVALSFKITKLKPEESSVLEIGTGTGRVTKEFLRANTHSFQAVEPTTALRNHVINKHGVEVFADALPNLTSVAGEFDMVFSLHVLEHAPSYLDARNWLLEMKRVVKPGGYVVVAAPNLLDYKSAFWDSDWSHGWPTTPNRIQQLMVDTGLEVVMSQSIHAGIKGRLAASVCHFADLILPTRALDALGMALVKRPLGTGVKIALIWGLTYAVGKRI